jgi:hypothetical protein
MDTYDNSTTELDRRLVALLGDLKTAEDTSTDLDEAIAFDLGCLLLTARTALQQARDLLDALPFDHHAYEPRTCGGKGEWR